MSTFTVTAGNYDYTDGYYYLPLRTYDRMDVWTSDLIVITKNGCEYTYYGEFTFSATGSLSDGSVTGVTCVPTSSYGSQIGFEISGFDMSVTEMRSYTNYPQQLVIDLLSESDRIITMSGTDRIFASSGDDTISSGSGDDLILAGGGDDRLFGEKGNDTLSGMDDDDTIFGGQGNDVIVGGAGADSVFGQIGNDHMDGGDGSDWLHGGKGNDAINGGGGEDLIMGGAGNDTLEGGEGNDVFHFGTDQGYDVVQDFEVGVDRLAYDVGVNPFIGATEDADGSAILIMGVTGRVLILGVSLQDLINADSGPMTVTPTVGAPSTPATPTSTTSGTGTTVDPLDGYLFS